MSIQEMYPYLRVKDAEKAIEFYCATLDAKEKFRLVEPSGRIGHCELDIDGMTLMLSDEFPEYGIHSATTIGDTPVAIHLHVDDADQLVAKALANGATLEMPLTDHFYGERSGRFRDPFGHLWIIGHSIEDVATEEMQRRYAKMFEDR